MKTDNQTLMMTFLIMNSAVQRALRMLHVVHRQKNSINKKPKNRSPSKTITGIFISISKIVTLRLIYTIIITNQGEGELLFGF